MRIGELAKISGVEVETIRFYERDQLLPPPAREANGYRRYTTLHQERLAFIRHCRALDMPLADIRQLLDFVPHPEADCEDINQLIDAQLERVRSRLSALQSLEQQLQSLRSRCSAHHQARDCGILNELVAAAQGEVCACHDKGEQPTDRQS